MRDIIRNEPPSDMEFPHFKVEYYDEPSAVVTIKVTDASSDRWPDVSPQSLHDDGTIVEMKPSSGITDFQWRQKIGELLTYKFLLYDEHLSVRLQPMIDRRCFLKSFPPEYKLFTYAKEGRLDHYLIGSKTVNCFRSPQEFFPHARWLMMGAKMDSDGYPACKCKYCGPIRSQTEVDKEFQLPGRKESSHKHSGLQSSRYGSSLAATSETIISQAKDYRNLKKPNPEAQQAVSKGIDPASL